MKRSFVIIFCALSVAIVASVVQRDAWSRMLSPSPSDPDPAESMDGVPEEVEPLEGSLPPRIGPAPQSSALTPTPSAPHHEALVRLARVVVAQQEALTTPIPETLPRWHHAAEALSGLTLEDLLKVAYAVRRGAVTLEDLEGGAFRGLSTDSAPPSPDPLAAAGGLEPAPRPAPTLAGAGTPSDPATEPAKNPADLAIESATLEGVIIAGSWAEARLGGHRLTRGQEFPGTAYRLIELTPRRVVLSDGQRRLEKDLMGVPTQSGYPEPQAPDPEDSPKPPTTTVGEGS